MVSNDCITDTTRYSVQRAGLLFCIGFELNGNRVHRICIDQKPTWQFPFDSNSIQNKSPARRTLYLVVSVMQLFEATCWLPKTKHKQYYNNSFNVSTTLVIFNVFLERTSFL